MKCPKCGYNSFDHLEACRKCGNDLLAHRTRFGLKSLFFGGGGRDPEPRQTAEAEAAAPGGATESSTHFGFDFMDEEGSDERSAEFVPDGEPENEQSPSDPGQAFATSGNAGETGSAAADDEFPDPFADEFAQFEPASENDLFPETFTQSDPEDSGTGEGRDPLEFDPFADEAAFSEAEPLSELTAPAAETAPPLEEAPLSIADRDGEVTASLAAGKQPDDLFAAGMQEEDGFGETNLAEMFLESLDADGENAEPPETTPFRFNEEGPFADVFADVSLVEEDLREKEAAEEGHEEPEGWTTGEGSGEDEPSGEAPPPSLRSRFGAAAADLLILTVIFLLFLAAGEAALGAAHGDGIFPSPPRLLEMAMPYFLVLFASCFGYFTLFHFLLGQTPGKMLFRLKVIAEDGEALLFSQAFLRSVGGLLSILPAGLGYLRILFDARRRGWNDRLANSYVVSLRGEWAEPGENPINAVETE